MGVDPRDGPGACFWIEMPISQLAEAPSPKPLPACRPEAAHPLPGGTVLYVEDNPANLKLVEQIVARHEGLRFVAATRAREGLALAREHLPQLILLDIDGYALLAELRADPRTRGIPVVVVTAHAMRDDERRARAAGCVDYLAKPIDIEKLDLLLEERARAAR